MYILKITYMYTRTERERNNIHVYQNREREITYMYTRTEREK